MVEIEMKARVADPRAVREKLAGFFSYEGEIEKDDEYWSAPILSASMPAVGFRYRIRREGKGTTVTFKDKTYSDGMEINSEVEFLVSDEAAFRSFMARLSAQPLYRKKKKGSQWRGKDGLLAELVEVDGLGFFLEIEQIVDDARKTDMILIKEKLTRIMEGCGLAQSDIESRPYSQLMGMGRN